MQRQLCRASFAAESAFLDAHRTAQTAVQAQGLCKPSLPGTTPAAVAPAPYNCPDVEAQKECGGAGGVGGGAEGVNMVGIQRASSGKIEMEVAQKARRRAQEEAEWRAAVKALGGVPSWMKRSRFYSQWVREGKLPPDSD